MAKATILFADNDLNFLETRKQFLQRGGYQVISAASPDEAKRILELGEIDLAILDLRLKDDDDDKDASGLDLAKEAAHSVPKIILTGFPTYEYVRVALKPSLDRLSVAVDFVDKKDGPQALLEAVDTALNDRCVFIVHGRDEAAKEATARFMETMGLQVIILHEQANAGRTIIEKVENYANVGFVVALLTPDDIGSLRTQPEAQKLRARQNVIFELGYFIGKLGRERVCALYKDGVEIPSDYYGVLYLPMDTAGGWKLPLAKEINRAGLKIDMSKVI